MFVEGNVTAAALRLFISNFKDKLDDLKEQLRIRHDDIEFLVMVMEKFRAVDPGIAVDIMKSIYEVSNDLGKSEVVKAMGTLEEYDKEFMFEIIRGTNTFLKKEALLVLSKDLYDKKQALDMLFMIPNKWGAKNDLLLEHIALVEEMELQSAKDYLYFLSKSSIFWAYKVRKRALEALKRWQ
jgi:hypothetical protein